MFRQIKPRKFRGLKNRRKSRSPKLKELRKSTEKNSKEINAEDLETKEKSYKNNEVNEYGDIKLASKNLGSEEKRRKGRTTWRLGWKRGMMKR